MNLALIKVEIIGAWLLRARKALVLQLHEILIGDHITILQNVSLELFDGACLQLKFGNFG
jgi:hypothetical protein